MVRDGVLALRLEILPEIRLASNRQRGRAAALEPVAAIGHPPARISDGNGGEYRPPEGQRQIRHQAQSAEGEPKNLSLHIPILTGIRALGAAPAKAIPQLPIPQLPQPVLCSSSAHLA
jgi:hypothetical protein